MIRRPFTLEWWNTPRILHAAQASIAVCSVLFAVLILLGVRQHRHALKTVGQDATPSILAALSIKTVLADMDANVANELMVGPGHTAQSIQSYSQRRKEVGEKLIGAAENITYGEAERRPILTLEAGIGAYEVFITRARTLYEHNPTDPDVLRAYRQAHQILEGTLFPAADVLARANTSVLDREYHSVQAMSLTMSILVTIAGMLLFGTLIATQLFLSVRMRRTFNPALLAAAIVTFGLLTHTAGMFSQATNALKIAREDAFSSIQALSMARAVAYDANTDESRWLLDREQADAYQAAFFAKTAQLLQLPGGQSYDSVAASTQGMLPQGTKGYLAQEMDNITFAGEREAAQQTIRMFGVYYADDQKIRLLEKEGKHRAAIDFCISMASGDSNWAFDQFDRALGTTMEINQHAFDGAIRTGFQQLKGTELYSLLSATSVLVLGWIGLRPRLKEYAF